MQRNKLPLSKQASKETAASKSIAWIVFAAVVGTIVGVVLFRIQGGSSEPFMSPLGVVSLGSLGACVGCLMVDSESKFSRWW